MKIVIHSNASWGGIVDYMLQQADAIAAEGNLVTLVVPETFDREVSSKIEVRAILPNLENTEAKWKFSRRMRWIVGTLKSWRLTCRETRRLKPDALLLSAYSEYLAPLWTKQFFRLRRKVPKLRIAAIVHDPIRISFGPKFLHSRSVRSAYEMLDLVFTHYPVDLNQEGADPRVPSTVIPHGVSNFPDPGSRREEIREKLGIPNDAIALLAFGHIRDSKNLDLAVKLLAEFPRVHLVLAGKVMSSRDRPVSFYRDLAASLGVANQLTILDKFIPETEAADLFSAADFVLLSYNRGFVSASSVLHVAIKFRKLALATSGDGHLKWAVEKYNLGIWTEPDSATALKHGMKRLLDGSHSLRPRWEDYEMENSWARNAELITEAFAPKE